MIWPAIVSEWGTTPEERASSFPCDRLAPEPVDAVYRAVDVQVSPEHTFRWLCQLRAAPYSYDWLDNWGRQSPPELIPGLEQLEPGQAVMSIFRLIEFEQDRSLTILSNGPLFGRVAVTYRVDPVAADRCRLVVKASMRAPRGPHGPLVRFVLPPGDLLMMRRQLLNLAQLAERSEPRAAAVAA